MTEIRDSIARACRWPAWSDDATGSSKFGTETLAPGATAVTLSFAEKAETGPPPLPTPLAAWIEARVNDGARPV